MIKAILTAIVAALLCGCASQRYDESARLMSRPDFESAKSASPEWCRDALKTINYLEEKLEAQPVW